MLDFQRSEMRVKLRHSQYRGFGLGAGSQKSFSTFQLRSESDFIPKREVPEAESGSSMESSSGLLLLGDEFMTLSTFAQKALHYMARRN